jgi:leucine dehydrogenase
MRFFDSITEMGHEQVVMCHDRASGYRGIIAIHDTTLGPALGGLRFWNYKTDEEAYVDALRLSRGMTYKNAVAGLNLGGGKAVMIGDNRTTNREMLFRAHGRFVDSLGGRYITAEDVGTSVEDMDFVHMETTHVTGIGSKSGDPSSVTAHGVFRAIEASAKERWGSDSLEGKRVALQGCGNVGFHLARELFAAGATLVVTDIDEFRIKRVVDATHADVVDPDAIYGRRPTSSPRARSVASSTTPRCRSCAWRSWPVPPTTSCSRRVMATSWPRRAFCTRPTTWPTRAA